MQLKDVLLVLMAAGSGGIVFWLMDAVAFLANLPSMWKRLVSLALSGVIPILAWLIGVAFLYWAAPVGWRAWIEALFAIAAGGIITSQTAHGIAKLNRT
jgi:zinc transporter ZupT